MMENIKLNIRLKEGNPQAYKELFKQTFPRMLLYCRLFIHDQAQSNDLVQECFIKLWERHNIIKPFKSVESLLFVMLRNGCLDYIRNQKTHNIEKDTDSLGEDELQYLYQLDFTGHEEASLKEKLFESVKESIEKLPEKRKKIFINSKIKGKKNKDIAKELNISIKAVEKQLHLAKEQIRKRIRIKYPIWVIIIDFLLL